ncbi:MAG: hypothetical protein ACP5IM_05345 [Candidatus Bathyarchaeia archaeon]|nr:MAG: hypothetical protein C0195_00995 [Candidatus Bathyarchaeota archaeon]
MVECPNGKLLVYASSFAFRERRLKSVSMTVARIAKLLNLDFELVAFKGRFKPIYVYYENGGDEPVPLYCNKNGKFKPHDVCSALKSMMFVLSFHPRYSALRRMRSEIMRLS